MHHDAHKCDNFLKAHYMNSDGAEATESRRCQQAIFKYVEELALIESFRRLYPNSRQGPGARFCTTLDRLT